MRIRHTTLPFLACVIAVVYGGGGGGPSYGTGPSGGIAGGSIANYGSAGPDIDFNPALLQGTRGFPGIRARLNMRAFQYANSMISDLLNTEIKRARLPSIAQCVPQVNGCIQIYNLYVSRYRCPQSVMIYPAPPNRIIVAVQNLDVGITGNLGGQIVVLLPLALFGIVQLNLHQVTVVVDLAIERGPTGPYVRMNSCQAQIGYADAYIENGGLIGDIVNSQFRSQISGMVRQMVPGQICKMLPSLINEKLNGKLASLPQMVSVSQMLSLFGGALGLSNAISTCPASCGGASSQPLVLPSTGGVSSPSVQAVAPSSIGKAPEIPQGAYNQNPPHRQRVAARARGVTGYSTIQQPTLQVPHLVSSTRRVQANDWNQLRTFRAVPYYTGNPQSRSVMYVPVPRAKRQAIAQRVYVTQLARAPGNILNRVVRNNNGPFPVAYHGKRGANFQPKFAPPPPVVTAVAPHNPAPTADCGKCPASGAGQEDPASFIKQLAANLDMSKLNDLYLSLQLLNTYATNQDFTIDLTGEFSVGGQGGTPFGAFPVQFPSCVDCHMAEFILSDYTLNSLFYWLHRKQFLSFRIGPETPKIGELLKTTCSDDEDGLEPTDVELDEEENKRKRRLAHLLKTYRRVKRAADFIAANNLTTISTITFKTKRNSDSRGKRQEDAGGLADLGICFGDILPAVREKYPNQKISILIHTVRAPSVILSAQQGGTATLDLIADADIFIDGTNNRVGTITIAATVNVVLQILGNRITGTASITNLKLSDRSGSLGLPQDALDNLGNLGKELLQKLANDALSKGISVNIPSSLGGLPISIINPSVRIVEHGIYIATDIAISPSLLGVSGGC